ncbi:MAG: F0F1 ATP synthase subunit gamma [Rhodospirillaceae bacterium]|nr:F0F1 ATP synthase subunit gamma [Rhodospirillaceae bacterium]|tara:strand:+ start:7572 stop:8468 length:897 start_codon:yes stop_codon:yes gene_type:complete
MSGLKELRNRIGSVKSTQKITKAMQMVAASKLRKAQESVEASRPYASRMRKILKSLSSGSGENLGLSPILVGTGKNETYLLVVATSERGLCGAFNSSIVRAVRKEITFLQADNKNVKLLCIGKKGRDMLRREYGSLIIETFDFSENKNIQFKDIQDIGKKIIDLFGNNEFDICKVYFNRFKSVMSQIVTSSQLIPANIEDDVSRENDQDISIENIYYDYEPDQDEILDVLLPKNINVQIFQALLENAASEQGARMAAMDNATRNAGEMIDHLTLVYNRTRQAVITSELIEIISGAEAI